MLSNTTVELTSQQLLEIEVNMEADTISIGLTGTDTSLNELRTNIVLPDSTSSGIPIYWSSSNAAAILTNGTVIRSEFSDQAVTLTAYIQKNGYETNRVFYARVMQFTAQEIALIEAEEDADAIIIELGGSDSSFDAVTSDLTLPTSGANGSIISWSSSSPDYVAADGTIGLRDQTLEVWLTAAIEKDGQITYRYYKVTVIAN